MQVTLFRDGVFTHRIRMQLSWVRWASSPGLVSSEEQDTGTYREKAVGQLQEKVEAGGMRPQAKGS